MATTKNSKNAQMEEINLLTIRQYKREESKEKKNAILNDILVFNAPMIKDCVIKCKHLWNKKCKQLGIGIDEVENTARMGLVKAIERFDINKKTSSLSFYFYTFMEYEIKVEYNDNRHYNNIAKKIAEIIEKYESYGLSIPSATEIAQMLGISIGIVLSTLNFINAEKSMRLDSACGSDENKFDGYTYIEDPKQDVVDQVEKNIMNHDLHKQIALLDSFEKQLVLIYKYGIRLMTNSEDKHDKHIIILHNKLNEFENSLSLEQKNKLQNVFCKKAKKAQEMSTSDIAVVMNISVFRVTELIKKAQRDLKRNSIIAKYNTKGVQTDSPSVLSEDFTLRLSERIDERLISGDDDLFIEVTKEDLHK